MNGPFAKLGMLAGLAAALSLPASAGTTTYQIDPRHSSAGFGVTHLMISTVRGEFHGVTGTVVVDDNDVSKSTVNVTIDATTRSEEHTSELQSHVNLVCRLLLEKKKKKNKNNNDLPWNKIIGMRTALVHDYLNIARERIISVIKNDHHLSLTPFSNSPIPSSPMN